MKQANSHACVSIALYYVSIKSTIGLALFCFVLLQFFECLASFIETFVRILRAATTKKPKTKAMTTIHYTHTACKMTTTTMTEAIPTIHQTCATHTVHAM